MLLIAVAFSVDDHTLVADDKEADAFGPVAKDLKIKNLRTYLFTDIFYIIIFSMCNWIFYFSSFNI